MHVGALDEFFELKRPLLTRMRDPQAQLRILRDFRSSPKFSTRDARGLEILDRAITALENGRPAIGRLFPYDDLAFGDPTG